MLPLGFLLFFLGVFLFGAARRQKPAATAPSGPWRCFGASLLLTVMLQSSSAMLSLAIAGGGEKRAVPWLVAGANLGSVSTLWLLLGLSGWEAAGVLGWVLIAALLAAVWRWRGICSAMGLAAILLGLRWMTAGAAGLLELPICTEALGGAWPLRVFGLLTALTALVQSSGAVSGLLLAVSGSGTMTVATAIIAVAAINLGTCSTALLASFAAERRVNAIAGTHCLYNLLGCGLAALTLLLAAPAGAVTPLGLALLHTAFNLVTAVFFLPLAGYLRAAGAAAA